MIFCQTSNIGKFTQIRIGLFDDIIPSEIYPSFLENQPLVWKIGKPNWKVIFENQDLQQSKASLQEDEQGVFIPEISFRIERELGISQLLALIKPIKRKRLVVEIDTFSQKTWAIAPLQLQTIAVIEPDHGNPNYLDFVLKPISRALIRRQPSIYDDDYANTSLAVNGVFPSNTIPSSPYTGSGTGSTNGTGTGSGSTNGNGGSPTVINNILYVQEATIDSVITLCVTEIDISIDVVCEI
jgi:hypothetical protein